MPKFAIELTGKEAKILERLVEMGLYKTTKDALQLLVKEMLEEINTFLNVENDQVIDEIIENLMVIKKGVRVFNK